MNHNHFILVGRTSDAIASGILGEFGHSDELKITAPTNVIQSRFGTFGDGESIFELFVNGKLHDHPIEQNLSEEEKTNIEKELKDSHVTIVHSSSGENTSSRAMSLLDGVHDLKGHYGVGSITVIAPQVPYMRNDRRFRKLLDGEVISQRNAIAGKNFARRLKQEGADNIVSFEPHSLDGLGYYKEYFGKNNVDFQPMYNFAAQAFLKNHDILLNGDWSLACGSPDGLNKPDDLGIARAKKVGLALYANSQFSEYNIEDLVENIPWMFGIHKVRIDAETTKIIDFSGNVHGRKTLLIDDLISGGGTLIQAGNVLREHGATGCSAYSTHGVLTEGALEKLASADSLDEIIFTDTIPSAVEKLHAAGLQTSSKFRIETVAPLILKAIESDHTAQPNRSWPAELKR